jgi:lysophospholipase L1-like esterase
LRLYQGVEDEAIAPTERVEPPVDSPARTWIRNDGALAPWRSQLATPAFSPRLVVLADSTLAGPGLEYLGLAGETMSAHTLPRRLARDMRLRYRFKRMAVGQEIFQEATGRYLSLAETSDPYAQGFRLHGLHASGIRSMRRSGAVERAKSHHPDWVLVVLGHMDVDVLGPEPFRAELRGLLRDLMAAGLRPIVVSPVPVLDASPSARLQGASPLRRALDFRQACDDLAAELDLPFVDLTLAILHRGTAYPGALYADPFLLNRDGHRFVSRLLLSLLTGEDAPLWHDLPEPLRMRTEAFDLAQYAAERRGVDLTAKAPSILARPNLGETETRPERERDAVNLYINSLMEGLGRGGLQAKPITPPRD